MVIEFVVKKHFKTFTIRIEQKNALFCLLALSLFNVTKFYAIHLLQLSIVSLTVNVSSDHLNIRERSKRFKKGRCYSVSDGVQNKMTLR